MIDPVTLTIVKNALDTIVDDMAYTVMRTARSPIVRDVLDYSCTICDARGRILTQAKTVALHLGAVPDAMLVVMETFADDLEDLAKGSKDPAGDIPRSGHQSGMVPHGRPYPVPARVRPRQEVVVRLDHARRRDGQDAAGCQRHLRRGSPDVVA